MTYKQFASHGKSRTSPGFTLIELSIVLVIIGLIIGGILTGQNLINAAETRATLAQIEKYNTAVNTFRGKFGGIPGDLLEASASSFGLYAIGNPNGGGGTPAVGSAGFGDGNGLIEGGAAGKSKFTGEVVAFFRQLSDANLIDGTYAQWGTTDGTLAGTTTATSTGKLAVSGSTPNGVPLLLPTAKMGRGNFIAPFCDGSANYFVITGLNGAAFTASGGMALGGSLTGGSNNITAQEAYNMDKKVDDGLPGTGSVFAWDATAVTTGNGSTSFVDMGDNPANPNALSGVATCVTGSAYAVSNSVQACSLRFKFQ